MKIDMNRPGVTFVLGMVFACVVFGLAPWMLRAHAQSATGYGHLYFDAGHCNENDQNSRGVIDTRNGNIWCVSSKGEAPIYRGKLNLAGIPAHAPGRP